MTIAARFFKSHLFRSTAPPPDSGANTVQLFLDYCCPFSKILFLKWYDEIMPRVRDDPSFQIVIHQVVQPWHVGSLFTNEAALAVARVSPDKFIDFSRRLFIAQERWFDSKTSSKTRDEVYHELASFAEESVGVSADEVYALLRINSDEGNSVTRDLKYFVRYHRQLSVHATPTVAVNGVVTHAIESSTPTVDAWKVVEMFC